MSITHGTEKLAKALLLPINPAAVILLGIYTVVWGLWVVNPFWSVFSQAGVFSILAQVAPEVFWGFLAISCGLVTIYGAVKRSYGPLVRGAATSGWHWLMIATFFLMGNAYDPAGITALIFMIYSAFVYLNIRVNYKNDKKSDKILH